MEVACREVKNIGREKPYYRTALITIISLVRQVKLPSQNTLERASKEPLFVWPDLLITVADPSEDIPLG